MDDLIEEHKLKIGTFSWVDIVTSNNARVKDALKELEDKTITDRICSYSETHYQSHWSQGW